MAAPNRRGLRWAPFVIATFIVFVAPASTNASTVSADELDVSTISGLSGQDWVAVSTTLFFP
ncbi:MAG: hypothetical protein NTX64_02095, partial [Elusimicrobia bacterium]|nr:hypothetical protein [Elusimicrobiota bacterium]